MRIDQLALKHFKGFEDREFSFHPEFNLLVGRNGTGKTSALDALTVAVGGWFVGIEGIGGTNTRPIRPNEVMLGNFEHAEIDDQGQRHVSVNWEYLYPCEVAVQGEVLEKPIGWLWVLNGPEANVNIINHKEVMPIVQLALAAKTDVREGKKVSLPLISYYGTERLGGVLNRQLIV